MALRVIFMLFVFNSQGCLCQTTHPKVVINEIMASASDPKADYIEIYNRSDSPIWLDEITIEYTGSGKPKRFGTGGGATTLAAGAYHVMTKDADALEDLFETANPQCVVSVDEMPSLATNGTIAILGADSAVIDIVHYREAWHNPLMGSHKDVSLERIDTERETDDAGNWTSAITEHGNATPSARNSASANRGNADDGPRLKINTKYISPRGKNGAAVRMEIEMRGNGSAGGVTMTIYDGEGRPVARPYNNAPAGNGLMRLTWDGRDSDGHIVAARTYIVLIETWNTSGRSWTRKETVTVGD